MAANQHSALTDRERTWLTMSENWPGASGAQILAKVQRLEEQKETLDRAVIALALETATGLCWCPRWYRERNPGDGYEPHHETCARIRVLVPYPASVREESNPNEKEKER